jgi:RNA polymerase sigma factor (sigma-70 family)
MHSCAYRAVVRAGGRAIPRADREAWLARWQTIRSLIVERNLGLVHSMVGRFNSAHVDSEDLLSEAMYGLVRAVDRYNPWRGYQFSTYACNVIIRALMRRSRIQTVHRSRFPLVETESCERPDRPDPGAGLYLERLRGVMKHNRGELNNVESTVLSKRFPTNNASPMTFREISKVVGLSRERIRQIEHTAILKLRTALLADPLIRS